MSSGAEKRRTTDLTSSETDCILCNGAPSIWQTKGVMARKSRKQNRRLKARTRLAKPIRWPRKVRWLVPVLLAVFILGGLLLRASDLRADPPPDLSWSFAPYTDEGLNTYSARNFVLYGAWKVDDFFPFVVYPLVNFLVAVVFKLFGLGFVQVKIISLLAGIASIWVIYLLVKDESSQLAGIIAALLTATCYPLVMYTRLGLVESVQILFLLLAGLFFSRGLKRSGLMVLSGLFAAGTVLLVKISAVFVVPVMAAVFVWQFIETRKDRDALALLRQGLGFWFAGVGAALLVWFLAVFLPYRGDYIQYVLRHSLESPAGHPESLSAYLLNIFTVGAKSRLIPRLPFVALFGFLFLPGLGIAHRPGLRYLFAWFVFATLMLGYMNYRPPRYEIILLPPLIVVFAAAVGRLFERGTLVPQIKPAILKSAFYCLWLWPLMLQLTFYSGGFWGALHPDSEAGLLAATFGISLAMVVLGHLVLGVIRREMVLKSVAARTVVAGILLLLVLRFDLAQYFGWFNNRTHYMVEYSQDLDRILPDGAVLAGSWAPTLLMESDKRALCVTDWTNTHNPIGKYGVTHLVSPENGFDRKLFERLYPDIMERSRVFRRYNVRGLTLTVHELSRGVNSQEEN